MPWYEYSAGNDGRPMPLAEVQLWYQEQHVRVVALVDSGADYSLFDVRYADALGLERDAATIDEAVGAGGVALRTYRWLAAPLEIQFEAERFPFRGSFAAFFPDSGLLDLLDRRDFFQPFIIQFWDAAELMNIDHSPDFPRPPLAD